VTATTPAHPAGAVDVKISNTSGSSSISAGSFNFIDPVANPTTVTAITPESGPSAGGIPVTITGSGFVSGLSVAFGGSPASTVTVVSGTQITAIVPAHPAGAINVTITDINGTSVTSPSQFTFI
jgi:IPT/TIG domain